MKKILFSMILAVAAMNINAQLVVDSLGRVGVGTDEPKSVLSVGVNTSSSSASAMASIQSGGKSRGHIKHNKDVNFKIPTGVTLEQNQGIIE